MNIKGLDLLNKLNNTNNTFLGATGAIIKNSADSKMKTLNSFVQVIPIKMCQIIEEKRPLSAPKKKKKKNKHYKIFAKNKKKKELKKISSTDKDIKLFEKKAESSRANKFLNIILIQKQVSKSESQKLENLKSNNKIIINQSNLNNNNKSNTLRQSMQHEKYKSELNTIEETDSKKKIKKKDNISSNVSTEEQKNNNINNNIINYLTIKPKKLFKEKEKEKNENSKTLIINSKNSINNNSNINNTNNTNNSNNNNNNQNNNNSHKNNNNNKMNNINILNYKNKNEKKNSSNILEIKNPLTKSINPSCEIADILNMNISHNIHFTLSYRNQLNKTLNKNPIINSSYNELNEKLLSKNTNSLENSKSTSSLKNKNENSEGLVGFNSLKMKGEEIRNILSKEDITERFIRIRKNYQEKEIHQSIQNLNLHFYLILPGNASYLVKNCMCHRTSWKEPFSKVSSLYNFKWQEISYGIEYNSLSRYETNKQIVNHYENHYCISNKANMFCYLMKYCEERKISVFKYVPFTVVFKIKEKKKDGENEIKSFEKCNLEAKDNLKKFINISQKFVVDFNDIGNYYNNENFLKEVEKREFSEEKNVKKKKKKKKEKNIINNYNNENKNNIGIKEEEKKDNEEKKDIEEKEDDELKEDNNIIEYDNFYSDFFPKLKPNERIVVNTFQNEINEKEKKKDKKEKKKMIGSNTLIELPITHESGKHMWLVKAINLNRGKCIKVVNSFEQIEKVIEKFKYGVKYGFTQEILDEESEIKENEVNKKIIEKENSNENNNNNNNKNENIENPENENPEKLEQEEKTYLCKKIIIQKYIEKPLLYKKRKCDIRIWVLLSHKMKVYVFKEGHLKTCSVDYNVDSKDAFTHITNYSFQKYNNNFQKFEKGNEVPFYEFQKFINEKYPNKKYNIKIDLMNKVKEIITLTMRAGKEKINKNNRNYQFEIFGYDFMLDEDFNVFLIEINTNPGLEESSPWIKIIIPRMLDDALRLTIDQIFEPKYDFSLNYKNENDEINYLNVMNNLKYNINPNNVNDYYYKKEEEKSEKNINNNNNNNNDNNNNQKYISPFPVPGYLPNDNLWEFICDLNEKDPLDERIEKEKEIEKNDNEYFTGIKHLIKKRKNIKNKKNK